MKYTIEGNNDYHSDILNTILQRRGVTNVDEFLNINKNVLEPVKNYKNIHIAYEKLMEHIRNENNIHMIIDTDVDGITSAALMYLYLKDLEKTLDVNIKITHHQNEGKKHGIILEDKRLKLQKIDLLIVPDAGTNDVEQIKKCYVNNVDVLILDHHQLEENNALDTKAILVNPNSSPNIKNKNISGVGVVYKFCKYIDSQLKINFADKYLDLVALGNIADIMDLRELETRYLVLQGLDNIQNDFIKELIEKQSFMMENSTNITTIGWNIAPLLNATIRVGKPKEKKDMFEALIGVQKDIKYKTKGNVENHSLQKTMARVCGNVKARQDRDVKKSVKLIQQKIKDNQLDKNKIILVDVTGILDTNYTGLVANKVASYYKKPAILLQKKENIKDTYGGSARNYNNFIIKELRTYLNDTGFFIKCAGHENAFGVEIKQEKIDDFIRHINKDLEEVEIDDCYIVDFEIPMSKLDIKIIKQIGKAKDIWGNKIDEPLFAITNVRINNRDIELKGERGKTITFQKKDIGFYRRFANEKLYDDFTLKPKQGINRNRDLNYTIIGKLKYNEWNGKHYPQVEIVDYNVKKENKIVF